jgi:hypothetical protein
MIAPSRLSPHFLTPRLEGEGGALAGVLVILRCYWTAIVKVTPGSPPLDSFLECFDSVRVRSTDTVQ